MSLSNKGYLPCYSCEGHELHRPRYVIVAFGSQEARDKFKNFLFPSWSFFFYPLQELETLSWEYVDGKVLQHQTIENETLGFNRLFYKSYEQYYFLKIHIGAVVYSTHNRNFLGFYLNWMPKKIAAVTFNFLLRSWLSSQLLLKIKQLENSQD